MGYSRSDLPRCRGDQSIHQPLSRIVKVFEVVRVVEADSHRSKIDRIFRYKVSVFAQTVQMDIHSSVPNDLLALTSPSPHLSPISIYSGFSLSLRSMINC